MRSLKEEQRVDDAKHGYIENIGVAVVRAASTDSRREVHSEIRIRNPYRAPLLGAWPTIPSMGVATMRPPPSAHDDQTADIIRLPVPRSIGVTSIERALLNRRSVREFSDESLTLSEISQLLWAAQGITDHEGLRSAPSAGALFPLELHLLSANITSLADGIYTYLPEEHELLTVATGAYRQAMAHAAQGQDCVAGSAAILVFSAVFERTKKKYGERGVMYVHMEVGHAVENVYLQAVALDLGTVVVGSFKDDDVKKVVQAPRDQQPLALMPIGRPSGGNR